MERPQAVTRDGTPWTPIYVDSIDAAGCIGCGRCFKVCGHNVLKMMGINEDGEFISTDDDDCERMVMTVVNPGNCIGCHACSRVCAQDGVLKFVYAYE